MHAMHLYIVAGTSYTLLWVSAWVSILAKPIYRHVCSYNYYMFHCVMIELSTMGDKEIDGAVDKIVFYVNGRKVLSCLIA